jgi:PBP1b-binding outer membrane lipoprotein LpoB
MLFAVGAACLLMGCTSPNPDAASPSADTPAAQTESTPEQNLATIDAGTQIAADDPVVAKYAARLDDLSEKYSATRQEIADQTAHGWDLLRKKGIDQSTFDLMSDMDEMFTLRRQNQSYDQFMAAYIVLRENGQSRQNAIAGLSAISHAGEPD